MVVATESLSEAVLDAVASKKGVRPEELTTPLFDVVDADALDSLFNERGGTDGVRGRVVFAYEGYEVTVYSDGTAEAHELAD